MEIPNLFTITPEAERLYSLMLCRLLEHEAFSEIVRAVRRIRIHARGTVGERAALFTHFFGRDALWHLGHHAANWARQVRFERVVYGRPAQADLSGLEPKHAYFLAEQRAPLHFACLRFEESARCKELQLAIALARASSTHLFYDVTNEDDLPTDPVRVTLRHIYEALGKPLTDWPNWIPFVKGFPPTLLRAAGTTHEALIADPNLLAGVGAALTRRHQAAVARRRIPERVHPSPWDAELQRWFPFLERYPHRAPSTG